jgi:heme-degrading monooxygenase HmoA
LYYMTLKLKYITNFKHHMAKIVEMDDNVKFSSQLEEDVGPIVFVNKFTVNPEDFDEFLKAWEADATYFKSQPGLISTQLHKGIGASGTFVNYAIWESTSQFKRAVNNTDFQTRLSNYPAGTIISPHIFKKVAVPGICVE